MRTLPFALTELPLVCALFSAIRGAVRDVDPALPVLDPGRRTSRSIACTGRSGCSLAVGSLRDRRAGPGVPSGFDGLTSHSVLRRTSQIGLRMALGAPPAQVLRMALRESLQLVAGGIVVGTFGELAAARLGTDDAVRAERRPSDHRPRRLDGHGRGGGDRRVRASPACQPDDPPRRSGASDGRRRRGLEGSTHRSRTSHGIPVALPSRRSVSLKIGEGARRHGRAIRSARPMEIGVADICRAAARSALGGADRRGATPSRSDGGDRSCRSGGPRRSALASTTGRTSSCPAPAVVLAAAAERTKRSG